MKSRLQSFLPIILMLILLPLIIFGRTMTHEFVWDDQFILDHGSYLTGIRAESLHHIWSQPYNELYVPVALTAWLLLNQLDPDSPFNPRVFHAANIILHIINSLFVFFILFHLIKDRWIVALGAMMFAVHPVQVEVVALAWGLKDLLSASLGFGAMLIYLNLNDSNLLRYWLGYSLATLLFGLALFAKPSILVLPLILMVIDGALRGVSWKISFKRFGLWLALIVPIIFLTRWAQPHTVLDFVPSLWARPLIWCDAIQFYLWKLILPFNLSVSYGRTPLWVMAQGWFWWSWVIPVLILVVVLWKFTAYRYVWVGLVIFVLGWLPVSGFVPFEYQNWSTVADRYLYFSIFGIGIMLKPEGFLHSFRRAGGIVLSIICIAWVMLSYQQVSIWKNEGVLWSDAITKYPDRIPMPYNNRGVWYARQGQFDRALADFDAALRIQLDNASVYHNRGEAYIKMGDLPRALENFNRAIEYDPQYFKSYRSRAVIYRMQGNYSQALHDLNRVLQLKANDAESYYQRGYLYQIQGDVEHALADYQHALYLNPNLAQAYNNRGVLYQQQHPQQALADFTRAIECDPSYAKAFHNRGNVYVALGQYRQALADLEQALRLEPENGAIYQSRAVTLFFMGQFDAAQQDIERAQALGFTPNPDFVKTLYERMKAEGGRMKAEG